MMDEENKSAWAASDSEESSSGTSSSSKIKDEVQCLMANDTEECVNMQVTKSVKKDTRFVYGSSELNLLRLPFFRNGKDPLEDFDYNDPHCNPLLRPAAARTPSHSTAHQPASCILVQILPVGDIFPAVDNSSEKVLAWLYFVSSAFNASAGFLAFSTWALYFEKTSQQIDLNTKKYIHLIIIQLSQNPDRVFFSLLRATELIDFCCSAAQWIGLNELLHLGLRNCIGFALNHCPCALHLICTSSNSALQSLHFNSALDYVLELLFLLYA
ncbi:hypothetical protein F511_22128 [Dorcoceras hygrometricum]|uniref:Uncharacterized protein n=1 Tax=Dorcoceras hygrometricum TaxID=472368 RepID=A0A2Z7CJZ4_9LAMI|nr:hypothetical protein F511_22128 [Dorcoceras hygrometricum]